MEFEATMQHRSLWALTALASALAATWSHAEETAELGTVVVTGRREASRLEDTPQRIEVIGKEDIERTPSRELTDLLKKNSSVDVIQYPGNLSGIGIRGFRPEYSGINKHTLLLIDGRPAMATNLSLVGLDQVERIEVLKGPASALYGSSAMGGVINIITRESKGAIHGFGQVAYGSYDTKELKGAVGGAINPYVDFDYSGSWFDQGEDFRMGDGKQRPNTAYGQQSHALRLGFNLTEDWRLNVKSDLYRGRDIATPGSIADGLSSQSNKDMDRTGTDLSLTGRLGDHRLTARAFTGSQSYTLYKKTSATASDQVYLPYRSYYEDLDWNGWQLQDSWAWSSNSSLVLGIDTETAKSVSRSYNANGSRKAPSAADNERESTGLYAENTWFFNNGDSTVYVGARRDDIKVTTRDTPFKTGFTPSQVDFANTSPSAGFKHLLGQGFRLHGTAGQGFVTPDAMQLTGNATSVSGKTTTLTQGNSNLKPETSTTYDLGLEWSNQRFFADLTVFDTKVEDKIVNSIRTIATAPGGYKTNLSTYLNGSSAVMRGLEWEGRWRANDSLRFSLSGTHYFVRREQNGNTWTDVRNVPANTVRAAVDVEQGPWSGRFGLRYVGHWMDNNWTGDTSQYIRYAPFTTADVSLRYRLDKQQSISASIENLADRYYAEKGGYPLAGRNGRIAYRYDF